MGPGLAPKQGEKVRLVAEDVICKDAAQRVRHDGHMPLQLECQWLLGQLTLSFKKVLVFLHYSPERKSSSDRDPSNHTCSDAINEQVTGNVPNCLRFDAGSR